MNRILTGSKPPGPASKTGATPLGKGGSAQAKGVGGSSSGKGVQAQGKGSGATKANAQSTHQVILLHVSLFSIVIYNMQVFQMCNFGLSRY